MSTLYDRIGGRKAMEKIHAAFYDKVFSHPWLKLYFQKFDKLNLEKQQTDFMSGIMGGPKNFMGKVPKSAHRMMFITKELWNIRQQLLRESLVEYGLKTEEIEEWLSKDAAFESVVVKNSLSDCIAAYNGEEILNFTNPQK